RGSGLGLVRSRSCGFLRRLGLGLVFGRGRLGRLAPATRAQKRQTGEESERTDSAQHALVITGNTRREQNAPQPRANTASKSSEGSEPRRLPFFSNLWQLEIPRLADTREK